MRRKFKVPSIASSEITSESAYMNRRQFMGGVVGGTAGALAAAGVPQIALADTGTGGAALEYQSATPQGG
ncbi:MAG: twin-arginine translocation signal domain-containing protein, partial [Pseudomonadota bacterium]